MVFRPLIVLFYKMGYDLVRFIGKIDKEYLCQICKLVLENPVQIPCDHLFCYDCIKNWVITNRTCPVDHTALNITGAVTVFKSPCMAFRNLLYKLDITCEFSKAKLLDDSRYLIS